MIDIADAICKLLGSFAAITDEVTTGNVTRIYGTALPAALTEGWTGGTNGEGVEIDTTIYCEGENSQAHPSGDLVDTTARIVVFANDEDEAVRVARVVGAALQPGKEPTKCVAVGAQRFLGVRQVHDMAVGEGEDTGWPQCELKFGMSILELN